MTEIDEAIDWQGRAVSCGGCDHAALQALGRCRLLHACVRDRYARRIDRFFTWNQGLASTYLNHPHFEVRAIAAKFADIFLLPPLLDDPDETVRWNAVRRLPKRYALRLRDWAGEHGVALPFVPPHCEQPFQAEPWFQKTAHGGQAHPYNRPYTFQGHINEFAAILATCDVPLDAQFGTPQGPIAMGDLIKNAQMTANDKE
ncbi:4Fe4S-binding leucine-rich repeat protein, partial [Niveispirillum sp.]|uniref:4Fe4S-binding leucine-rich repeat protein n=1 Tax=Niveispirillum sp. TaxID=1917217 RepID=UPI001B5E3723